ncbi:MAG: LptF/LptG family permease [Treponemataceae bacterium]
MLTKENTINYKKIKFSPTLIFYLLKLFLPVFLIALIFFVLVLELGDIFYNLNNYIENKVSLKTILKIALLFLPKCISFAMPISMLFAGSYTLGNLYAKNELTIIFSSGVSLQRFVLPILIFSFLCSVGMFFFEDQIVIKTFSKKNALFQESVDKEQSLDTYNLAVMSNWGKVIYTSDYYDAVNKVLNNPKIIHKNDEGRLDMIIASQNAIWNEEKSLWVLKSSNVYRIDENEDVFFNFEAESIFDFLNEPPESFQKITANVDEMQAGEVKDFLDKLQQKGFSQTEYLVKYYQRFSFPFTIFIVLFLSISFGGYLKKNVLLMSLLLSLSFAVLYYVSQMSTAVLASWNLISPIVGAWLPFIVFFILSVFLIKKART